MPRISNEPIEEEKPALPQLIQDSLLNILGVPIFFAGVNRKANVGNFETIDCYSGIGIPMGVTVGELNAQTLQQIAHEAAEIGFNIVSAETFERYSLIKELQSGGR